MFGPFRPLGKRSLEGGAPEAFGAVGDRRGEIISWGRWPGGDWRRSTSVEVGGNHRSGGRSAAKANLSLLWQRVAQTAAPVTLLTLPMRKPGLGLWDDAMPLLSPYQTNPFALEPMRHIVSQVADVDVLSAPGANALFVNAVNVHTGCTRVFGGADLSVDAILASACAPLMFQAARIDGQSYWDGSYGANPSLWPLYDASTDVDILLVELAPQYRPETPTTAKNILNRINEIASINGLASELRALALINRSVPDADIRMHVISLPDTGPDIELEPSVKRAVGPVLFESLRRSGYAACTAWLASHRGALGARASVDVHDRYGLGRRAVHGGS